MSQYRQWRASDPKYVLLLVHGLGTHSGRWEAMADFFLENGISSYAVELPEGFKNYYEKILRLYGIARSENPGKKIFLVGESMGALISFLLARRKPGLFGGLICISPAFAALRKFPVSDCIDIFAHLFYTPGKRFALPFDSSMCTRDAVYRERLSRDPLEYRSITARVILKILLAQARAMTIRKMPVPVLFLVAGQDRIVDAGAARSLYKRLEAADKKMVEFPDMYHSLSVELGREAVFKEILDWVEERGTK